MKFFVGLLFFGVIVYGLPPELIHDIKEHAKEIVENCKKEVGATQDDIAPMVQYKLPTTKNGKCLLSCVNKKAGFQGDNGELKKDAALAAIEKLKPLDEDFYKKLKYIAETCLAIDHTHDDECETALSMFKCTLPHKEKVRECAIDFLLLQICPRWESQ